MAEFKHTEGPWQDFGLEENPADDYYESSQKIGTDKRVVARVGYSWMRYGVEHADGQEFLDEDTSRILACVNACDDAGLTNEVLESGILKELIEVSRDAREALYDHATPNVRPLIERITEILAKVTGEEA